MAKRLKTYRMDGELADAVAAKAAERGETVTDLITRACQAYIREGDTAAAAALLPRAEATVYTQPEPPLSSGIPESAPCRHPADRVEAGECRDCGADVW